MSGVQAIRMSANEYHADYSALSNSMLKAFCESPPGFEAVYISKSLPPMEPTRDMVIGHLTHAMVLEPETVGQDYRKIPSYALAGGRIRRGKVWEEWSKQNEAYTLLNADEWRLAERMAESVKKEAGPLIDSPGYCEVNLYWTHPRTGIRCKARIDKLFLRESGGLVMDLKTTGDLKRFPYIFQRLRYWLQEAHYSEGVELWTGQAPAFFFYAVERKKPHDCLEFEMPAAKKRYAREYRAHAMDALLECHRTGQWPPHINLN